MSFYFPILEIKISAKIGVEWFDYAFSFIFTFYCLFFFCCYYYLLFLFWQQPTIDLKLQLLFPSNEVRLNTSVSLSLKREREYEAGKNITKARIQNFSFHFFLLFFPPQILWSFQWIYFRIINAPFLHNKFNVIW